MYISPFFIYIGGTVTIGIISRIWVSFRRDFTARRSMKLTLFDPKILDRVLDKASDSDDPNILAEMKATLSHLNKQAFAQEFWDLDKDLAKYYNRVPKASKPTVTSALVRMINSGEKWLQIVGAKTCASLKFDNAIAPLTDAIAREADERFKSELMRTLDTFTVASSSTS